MIRRGDVYLADLSPVQGSEQGGVRPVVIIQNDTGNKYSPTVIVAAITEGLIKRKYPHMLKSRKRNTDLIKIQLFYSSKLEH